MSLKDRVHGRFLVVITLILLLSLPGCSLSTSRPSTGAPAASQAAPVEGEAISPAVLTEVAATLYAPVQATLTQQALAPMAVKPITPTAVMQEPQPMESAAPASPVAPGLPTATVAPTQGQPSSPPAVESTTAPQQSGLAYVITPSGQGAVAPLLPLPVAPGPGYQPPSGYLPGFQWSGYAVDASTPMVIAAVNLPSCGSWFTANFLIVNHSGYPFESLSISLTDLDTGHILPASYQPDWPFMNDDRGCFPGGWSRLESGSAAFAGASVANIRLSGHSIQANLTACSKDRLVGPCFSKSVDFVVP